MDPLEKVSWICVGTVFITLQVFFNWLLACFVPNKKCAVIMCFSFYVMCLFSSACFLNVLFIVDFCPFVLFFLFCYFTSITCPYHYNNRIKVFSPCLKIFPSIIAWPWIPQRKLIDPWHQPTLLQQRQRWVPLHSHNIQCIPLAQHLNQSLEL